jgi:hypothetical protein
VFPRLMTFKPDLIFISAGFDAHKKDTINSGDTFSSVLFSPPFYFFPTSFLPSFLLSFYFFFSTFPSTPLLPSCPAQCCHPFFLKRTPTISQLPHTPIHTPIHDALTASGTPSLHISVLTAASHTLSTLPLHILLPLPHITEYCLLSLLLIQYLPCPHCLHFSLHFFSRPLLLSSPHFLLTSLLLSSFSLLFSIPPVGYIALVEEDFSWVTSNLVSTDLFTYCPFLGNYPLFRCVIPSAAHGICVRYVPCCGDAVS